MHALSMTASLVIFWLMISGDFGAANLALGIAAALLVVAISLRMDVVDQESQPIHLTPRLPIYWGWLTRQVIKSNLDVTRRIWTPGRSISPTLVRLKLGQETALGKVIYANSITLTPGTVTLTIEGDQVLVHALSRADAAVLEQGEMNRQVRALECRCSSPPASLS
ncbi:MAG: Na+/H+ antiporter subunit E [Gammaproteobacteria bacterium]